jgi:hypothetical protein
MNSYLSFISTKARFVNPAVESGSTNHLFGPRTTDHDSFFRPRDCSREQGAQSAKRWTCVHQGGPRAALPANRVICATSEHPVHTHSQLARDGYFRHRVSSSELQPLIVLPPCEILAHRGIHRFDQPAHHGVALLADGPSRRRPPLDSSLGFSPR